MNNMDTFDIYRKWDGGSLDSWDNLPGDHEIELVTGERDTVQHLFNVMHSHPEAEIKFYYEIDGKICEIYDIKMAQNVEN
jgi:hypothetical protein